MSRHTIPHPTIEGRKLAYGFDRPLQYYFFQVFDGDCPDPESIIDSDDFMGCTHGELLEKVAEHGFTLPDHHAAQVAGDLPIDDTPPPDDWKPQAVPGWRPAGKWNWNGEERITWVMMARKIEEALEAFLESAENSNVVTDPQGRERSIQISVTFSGPEEG